MSKVQFPTLNKYLVCIALLFGINIVLCQQLLAQTHEELNSKNNPKFIIICQNEAPLDRSGDVRRNKKDVVINKSYDQQKIHIIPMLYSLGTNRVSVRLYIENNLRDSITAKLRHQIPKIAKHLSVIDTVAIDSLNHGNLFYKIKFDKPYHKNLPVDYIEVTTKSGKTFDVRSAGKRIDIHWYQCPPYVLIFSLIVHFLAIVVLCRWVIKILILPIVRKRAIVNKISFLLLITLFMLFAIYDVMLIYFDKDLFTLL